MTTLELLKAAMQDNKRIELMKTDAESKKIFNLCIYKVYEPVIRREIVIGRCVMCHEDEEGIEGFFVESTQDGKTEEQLFQTIADLYDGTVENFLEKVG